MRKFRVTPLLVLTFVASCSSQMSSDPDTESATPVTTAVIQDDAASDANLTESDWAATKEIDLELAWGGNVSLQVSIGQVTTITNPDSQISSSCPLNDLPPAGTLYQRIQVTLRSNSSREIIHPKVLLGSMDGKPNPTAGQEFFLKDDFFYVDCHPKEDAGFFAGTDIGAFEYLMNPGDVKSFQTLLTIKPNTEMGMRWALLVTSRDDEIANFSSVDTCCLSAGALVIGLHDFGATALPNLSPIDTGPNLVDQVCDALANLQSPSLEGRDSENLEVLARWSELPADLARTVRVVFEDYSGNSASDSIPLFVFLALDECRNLGY